MMCPRVCEPELCYGSNADGIYRHDSLTPKMCVCVCLFGGGGCGWEAAEWAKLYQMRGTTGSD